MPSNNARYLRCNLTDAEQKLWQRLRDKQIDGFKFRRQVPMGNYIVDFYCARAKLIIELDGGQHAANIEYDEKRTKWLNNRGHRVVRFWNNEINENIDGVLERICTALHRSCDCPPTPTLPRQEGGS